jgi:PAS domain-containing protein
MRDGMVVFDPHWRVVSLNPAAANMTRSSVSQSRGKPAAEILHTFGDLAAPLAAGPEESFEMTLGSGAGARSYEVHVSALRDFRDLLEGYLLMLRDVTERRRAPVKRAAPPSYPAAVSSCSSCGRSCSDKPAG